METSAATRDDDDVLSSTERANKQKEHICMNESEEKENTAPSESCMKPTQQNAMSVITLGKRSISMINTSSRNTKKQCMEKEVDVSSLLLSILQKETREDTSKKSNDTRKITKRAGNLLVFSPSHQPKKKKLKTQESLELEAVGGSLWNQHKVKNTETWVRQQQECFRQWFNSVLVSDPTYSSMLSSPDSNDENSAWRVLARTQQEASWRRSILTIYRSTDVQTMSVRLKKEIAQQRLAIRSDRAVYADVGLQDDLYELLSQYNPLWLYLGLEVIIGHDAMKQQRCFLHSTASQNKIKLPAALRRVILNYLIHDPRIARRFRLVQRLKTPVDGYNDATRVMANPKTSGRDYFNVLMETFLYKCFLLVYVLDRIGQERHVAAPCLFRTNARVKNSSEMSIAFCRLFLSKEGRIDRHLESIGYSLLYTQSPLDEVDWKVENTATDLKDGIRLAKILETLSQHERRDSSTPLLSTFLRVPAISRLQKIHNVELSLYYLQEISSRHSWKLLERFDTIVSGSRTSVASIQSQEVIRSLAKCIVDGHCEKTLAFLWVLMSTFQVNGLVNEDVLEREIERLLLKMTPTALTFYKLQEESQEKGVEELLLRWCRVVCAPYQIKVVDFETSFENGVVLCYLLHSYHPLLLEQKDIKSEEDKKYHFTLVNTRINKLGEIPIPVSDNMDKRMLITFVSYLQSRLINSFQVIHAAKKLKRWWKTNPRVLKSRLYQQHQKAACIQRMWYTSNEERLQKRKDAQKVLKVKLITSFLRMCVCRRKFLQQKDAIKRIQSAWRRYQTFYLKKRLQMVQEISAIRIQHFVQRYAQRKRRALAIQTLWNQVQHRRAVRIQSAWRTRKKRQAVTYIQKIWRGKLARETYKSIKHEQEEAKRRCIHLILRIKHRSASMRIQRYVRRFLTKTREWKAAIIIQRTVRGMHTRQAFQNTRASILLIQRVIRKRQHARESLRQNAAVCIQRQWRGMVVQRAYKLIKQQVIKFQAHIRGAQIRQHMEIKRWRCSAIIVQRNYRASKSRKCFLQWKHATIRIQTQWRMVSAHRSFALAKRCFTVLQAHFRGSRIRQYFHQNRAAVVIQRNVRMHQARMCFIAAQQAAVIIQAAFRGWICRRRRCLDRLSMLMSKWILQEWIITQQNRWRLKYKAAVSIQSTVRRIQCRNRYQQMQRSATQIQALVRGVYSRQRGGCYDHKVFAAHAAHMRTLWATWRIQKWFRFHHKRVRSTAAYCIQRAVRTWQLHRRSVATTKIQSMIRGWFSRRFVFDFNQHKRQCIQRKMKVARWKLEKWIWCCVEKTRAKRISMAAAIQIQKFVRGSTQRWRFQCMRTAAISIQALVRGVQSRQYNFPRDFRVYYRLQSSLRRLCCAWRVQLWVSTHWRLKKRRRHLLIKAKWVQLYHQVLQRKIAVTMIVRFWRSYKLKNMISALVYARCVKRAANTVQSWWRHLHRKHMQIEAGRRKRVAFKAMRHYIAANVVGQFVVRYFLQKQRHVDQIAHSTRRIQSWWRGMLVRLHQSPPDVTEQRKKLATMTLIVENPSPKPCDGTSNNMQDLKPTQKQNFTDESQPLTLGAKLEMALHVLLHGKRLQEMLFASHTIEMCTRYSRECCHKCVKLKITSTIFAAIRGLNRSRPHVELLHQLLLVLINLTSYERKAAATIKEDRQASDVRAVDALVDLLHVHRDMHLIFVLAARVLKYYLTILKPHISESTEVFNQWSDAQRRLRSLHELLTKKAQVAAWTSKSGVTFPGKASPGSAGATNVMTKINPKTAVSIVNQLFKILE